MSFFLWWLLTAVFIGGVLYVTINGLITRDKIREHLDHEEKIKEKPYMVTSQKFSRIQSL